MSVPRIEGITRDGRPVVTWTEGPDYPIVRCSRCGADLDKRDIASGFCWVCGDMGAVEFLREGGTWTK